SQLMSDRGLRDVYPRDARTGAKWAVSTRCLRDANGLSSLQELIAGPVDGDQVVGVVRFRLEQRPQPGDEVVDGPRERRVPVTPDVAQELLAAHDFPPMREQVAQEFELARRKFEPP